MGRAALDVRELIDALRLESVALAGWSLGVSVVLAYLDLFGEDNLHALCFIDGAPRLLRDDGWEHGTMTLQAAADYCRAIETHSEETIRNIVPQLFSVAPRNFEELLAEALRAGPPAGSAAHNWSGLTADFRSVLKWIETPVLVIHGKYDWLIPVSNTEVFAASVGNVRIEVFDDSGHSPFIEEPERFNNLVMDFLEKC